jgi:gliding motility-associated-like protein
MIITNKKLLFKNKITCLTKNSKFYLLFFVFITNLIIGQVNLVLNPSFEQLDSCPHYQQYIDIAKDWKSVNPYPCIVLLYNKCSSNIDCSVPENFNGGGFNYQQPRTGNGYVGMENFSPPPLVSAALVNFRRYGIGKLATILIKDKSYCGKIYINLSSITPYKINQFGLYFDDGTIIGTQTGYCQVLNSISPQISNNPSVFLDDTLNWTKIEGIFKANGTESRVTFGNFKDDASTNSIATGFTTTFPLSYYNIDDISLIPMDITAFAGNDVTICLSDTLTLGRPQEVGLECLWYTPGNSTPFSLSSNFTFKPTQTGTYTFIQKMDNCQISFDTVTVTVIEDCNSLIEIPNVFTPNNDNTNDTWHFQLKNATQISYTIYNRWGNIVHSSSADSSPLGRLGGAWDGYTTAGEPCTAGVYFYILQYSDANKEIQKKNGYITLIK